MDSFSSNGNQTTGKKTIAQAHSILPNLLPPPSAPKIDPAPDNQKDCQRNTKAIYEPGLCSLQTLRSMW